MAMQSAANIILPSHLRHRHPSLPLRRHTPQASTTATATLSPEKVEVFKSLEGWATNHILPLLKPVEKCWQPHDFLPDPSQPSDVFFEEVRALRERAAELPDEFLVVLVGNMITEDALPTYETFLNTLHEVRDETCADPDPWAAWTRAWTAEEKRHGDLLRTYLYLSGRVDMLMVERTVQHLIGAGMNVGQDKTAYMGFVYTSFQERATAISHGNTARLALAGGDPTLARVCGAIAADEKRHGEAYQRVVENLLEVDPTEAVLAIAAMMRRKVTMPAMFMHDGNDPRLFDHFGAVAQRLGVYTAADYADILDYLVRRWRLEKLQGLTAEGREAQDFLCGLPQRIRVFQERVEERAKKVKKHSTCEFSWIFNRTVQL